MHVNRLGKGFGCLCANSTRTSMHTCSHTLAWQTRETEAALEGTEHEKAEKRRVQFVECSIGHSIEHSIRHFILHLFEQSVQHSIWACKLRRAPRNIELCPSIAYNLMEAAQWCQPKHQSKRVTTFCCIEQSLDCLFQSHCNVYDWAGNSSKQRCGGIARQAGVDKS